MAPAQKLAYAVAHEEHTADDDGGGDKGGAAHLFELIKAELQAQSKEQKDNAYLRPGLDIDFVRNGGEKGKIGACDKAGDNLAQNQRLINLFKKNCRYACNQKNHGQVGNNCG